jgi:type IV secretory pathway VirJ component
MNRPCAGLVALFAAVLAPIAASHAAPTTIEYPGVGPVVIERPQGTPKTVTLFLSGDGGWNKGVVDMAHHLNEEGALVLGLDVREINRRSQQSAAKCDALAVTLEGLAHHVEQTLGLHDYIKPVIVGYSSGATLAYTALAQSPAGTFRGALSLGFCPDLEDWKPMCRGEGLEHDVAAKGVVYRPAQHLRDPWVAMQGEQDQVCAASQTAAFVKKVPNGALVSLPAVGHGYSVERNWLPQFRTAYHSIADVPMQQALLPADVDDLPLVELPGLKQADGNRVAIMLSGDGGWAGLDRAVADELNARGWSVVGWDSLRYFWTARTPQQAAHDLDRVVRHYAHAWHANQVLLIGYSQGADVLPFMVNRLPEATRELVRGNVAIGISDEAFFKFSVTHWIATPTGGMPIRPEVEQGHLGPFTCIYGADDKDSPCRTYRIAGLKRMELPGGHHFDGDYAEVARAVIAGAGV